MRAAVLAANLSLAALPAASEIILSLPIDCALGTTCHIQHYVDRDPGPDQRDYTCGGVTYDGHKGTDFALPTLRDMALGVNVLAAAPGIVAGTRDGMEDREYRADDADRVAGRECGNGLVIRHEDGFETQYCHMKSGSIQVRKGDRVARGQVLGLVGLSGKTQFPHLHLSVRLNGAVLDPFDGSTAASCGQTQAALWDRHLPYETGGLLDIGFAEGVPEYDAVKAGTAARPSLAPDAPGLVLFGYAFEGRSGDEIRFTISGPEGEVIAQSATLDRDQARYFRAAGKRRTDERWPAGRYIGKVELHRAGQMIDSAQTETVID